MELSKLVNSLSKVIQLTGEVERKDVESITYDSRKIKKNSLFVAVKGFTSDGHDYIQQAIAQGATAVIIEDDKKLPEDFFIHRKVTKILVHDSRAALAEISNAFYNEPSAHMNMVGITGTKGKTTISYLLKYIFETAGIKSGLIGTIANYIGDKKIETKMTTPESCDLNFLFSEMLRDECITCIMEVSSHSLALNRVKKIDFDCAVFTNITSDHMDFHGTFEEYFKSKKILFDSLSEGSVAVCNGDDSSSAKIVSNTSAKVYYYGKDSHSDFRISDINYGLEGTTFSLEYNGIVYKLKTSLVGEFNAYNVSAAFAAAVLSGVETGIAVKAIGNAPQVAGRFEILKINNKTVIVDYAHTADSLEKTLQAIKQITKGENPVYTVFGCGGNRDKTKRPVMGHIAGEYSHKVIVTSDNPRFEEPMDIINEITKGFEKSNFEVIESREEAIKHAIEIAEDNAVILIAGKGHEPYQEIKGVRSHLSDKEIAETCRK